MNPRGNELFRTFAKTLYLAAGLVITLWFLHEVKQVVLMLILALIIALAINAPVTWLERKNISRPLGTLGVFVLMLGISLLLGWLIMPRLVQEVPRLLDDMPRVMEGLADRVADILGGHPEIQRQLSQVVEWMSGSFGELWRHSDRVVALFILWLFLVAIVLYMVADPRPLLRAYIVAMPEHLRVPAAVAFARASEMVVGWVVANVILGGIKASASFAFLSLMWIPGAFLWSTLAFFSALIPRLGFYLMSIPPVLVALSVDPLRALWVGLFFWALSEFLGNFVAPRIQAETMDLHPVLLLAVTLALAVAFGVIGVLIASPVAGFIKAYVDEFYLARQPQDSRLEERVDAMLARDPRRAAP